MHSLRLWQRADILAAFLLLVIAIACLNESRITSFILWSVALLILFVGLYARKRIINKACNHAEGMGLARTLLMPIRETDTEIWFELHLVPPKKESTPTKVLRELFRDHYVLLRYAQSFSKNVIYTGTTHDDLYKAIRSHLLRMGLELIEHPNLLDPSAPMSRWQWNNILRKFYSKNNSIRNQIKPPNQWRTYVCRIQNAKGEDLHGNCNS